MVWSLSLVVLTISEILLIQRCSSRWNFYDRNGRRIRHNRYWKLNDYQRDESSDCPPVRSLQEYGTCPKKTCFSNQDCWEATGSAKRCLCDKALCGRVCVSIDARCMTLTDIPNGKVIVRPSNQPGGTATYSCKESYALKGPQKRMCKANGRWTGVTPKCVSQSYCGPPPTIVRAIHDAAPNQIRFASDTTVRYRCQEGFYFRRGYAQAICNGGEGWIGPQIKCRPISCGHPSDPANGRRIGNEFFFKRKVVFLCADGYKVSCGKGSADRETECQVRVCQANGRWSGTSPVCKPIRCPRLKAPVHGRVSGMWTKVNSILTFSCNPGYYLVGSRTRRCQRHGEWDGGNATCKIWNCGLPPLVPHARLNYTNTIYGSRATYRCVPNSSFSGESEILECGPDGIWTPEPPKCLSHCLKLKVANGTINVDNITRQTSGGDMKKLRMVPHAVTVKVKCTDGYHLQRTVFPRCQNGTWSVVPKCEPAPCETRPPIGVNAQARFYSLKHGAKAFYSCYLGYNRTKGHDVLICQFGQWIGTPPVCETTHCRRPTVPKNGNIYIVGSDGRWLFGSPLTSTQHDDLIEYQCKPGFRLKGQSNAVCINGEWRPTETPDCEVIRHKKLPLDWVLYKPRRQLVIPPKH